MKKNPQQNQQKSLQKDAVNKAKPSLNFRINGGKTLKGNIKVRTSKNGAVGIMCASLLNKGKTTIKNAPKIEEVFRIIEVLNSIGVKTIWEKDDLIIIPSKKIDINKINKVSAERTRSCIMLIGSLIHSYKHFKIPQAGGCRLGSRTVTPYLYALDKLGVKIDTKSTHYDISHNGLKPSEIIMYEAGDTVTETAIMAASLIEGETTLKFASANYQVQDICFYLEMLGVKIQGIGTSTLKINGVKEINQDIEYALGEDPIEAMSLITTAIVTNSNITIERCPVDFLELELLKLEKMGFKYKILKRYKGLNGKVNLVDIETRKSTLSALPDKIHAQPYPGINMDNLPFFVAVGAVAHGQSFIHDWVYEERAIYYKEIEKLGAEVILADPHRFYIKGPTLWKKADITCPPALRPSVVIMICMLAVPGECILRNVYNINRGYEDLAFRLNKIGADIEIFEE
jgi:UDP-N-acetylglucosamine 1-carboxyvinyltransferase